MTSYFFYKKIFNKTYLNFKFTLKYLKLLFYLFPCHFFTNYLKHLYYLFPRHFPKFLLIIKKPLSFNLNNQSIIYPNILFRLFLLINQAFTNNHQFLLLCFIIQIIHAFIIDTSIINP